jgi:hypothetical protein
MRCSSAVGTSCQLTNGSKEAEPCPSWGPVLRGSRRAPLNAAEEGGHRDMNRIASCTAALLLQKGRSLWTPPGCPPPKPHLLLARHRPSQSSLIPNDSDGALIQLLAPNAPPRTETGNPRGRPSGPESGAKSITRFQGRRFWAQMLWGIAVGPSFRSSEFQEKMRLGDICRLGFALLSSVSSLRATPLLRAFHRINQRIQR